MEWTSGVMEVNWNPPGNNYSGRISSHRVVRGGAWMSPEKLLRSSFRMGGGVPYRLQYGDKHTFIDVGFRLASSTGEEDDEEPGNGEDPGGEDPGGEDPGGEDPGGEDPGNGHGDDPDDPPLGDATVWLPTAPGNFDWNDGANWDSGTFPHGAGSVAYITNDITGHETIRLRQDITVGQLYLGDSGEPLFSYTLSNLSGENYTLTFDSGEEDIPARFELSEVGKPLTRLYAPLKLGSDLDFDLAGVDADNRHFIYFQGPVDVNGRTLRFVGGVEYQNQVQLHEQSSVSGAGTIINDSSSTITTFGNKDFTGTVVANGFASVGNQGTFTFTFGGFINAAELIINGYIADSLNRAGGSVWIGQSSRVAENPGQLLPYRKVTFNGGHLTRNSAMATTAGENDWQNGLEWAGDTVQNLHFNSGYSYFIISYPSGIAGTRVAVEEITRGPGATVYLHGISDDNKELLTSNSASLLHGAGGASGTTTRSIVPWMVIHKGGGSSLGNPSGFATYDPETGFRALYEDTEYATSLEAGADHNVAVGDVAIASDATINYLRYTSQHPRNIGAGRTLTVASGAILFVNNNGTIGASGNPTAGTLNFGTAEGIVCGYLSNNVIGADITGSGGFTKFQTGTLILSGNNSGLSGPVHVSGGTLRVGDGVNPSSTGSGDVHVHNGALLRVSSSAAINSEASLHLLSYGPYNGMVMLDAGYVNSVRTLTLGGAGTRAGTYGGPDSSAQYKLPQYFSGSGMITVTESTVEEEPTLADLYDDWADAIDWGEADSDPTADPDGDGHTNFAEFIAGTDPLDPASTLRFEAIATPAGQQLELVWASETDRVYSLQTATQPGGPYETLLTDIAATPPQNHLQIDVDPELAPQLFFRIAIEVPEEP